MICGTQTALEGLAHYGHIQLKPSSREGVLCVLRGGQTYKIKLENAEWAYRPKTPLGEPLAEVVRGQGLFALCRVMGLDLGDIAKALDERWRSNGPRQTG